MIRIDSDRHVNPEFISFMEWEHRYYANTSGPSTLVITLYDGTRLHVRHQPHLYGGADAYKVEKQILAAMAGKKDGE